MSKIIEILKHEHEEIIKFVGKLRTMCLDFMKYDKIDTAEFYAAVKFIKTYADERHHQKEEELLFKAMVEYIGVKAENIIKYGMLIEQLQLMKKIEQMKISLIFYVMLYHTAIYFFAMLIKKTMLFILLV